MGNYLANFTIKFIQSNSSYSDNDLLKIKYGIEGIYLTLVKIIIMLLIGLIFNYFSVVLFTMVFFNILRFFIFGLHTNESWQCLIISLIQFNLIPYIFLNINISIFFMYLIFIISFFSFLLFAPSDTKKRPLTNKNKRIIRKILSIVCLLIYAVIIFQFNHFKIPIICSLIIGIFVVNPFSYRLLGLSYNNYKKVNKA